MSASANENGHNETGFSWRIRQSTDQDVTAFSGPIVFELTDTHGSTLSTFTILPEKLNELLRPHLSIFAELQLDGSVSLDSEFFAISPSPTTTDLLELVRQALALEMLEDEPEAAQMLAKFRDRLLKSLEHVEQAIASLPKD